VAKDGYPYVFIPLLFAAITVALGSWYIALPLLLIAGFMAYFFRDPDRQIPNELNIIVAPADGRVTRVCPLLPEADDSPNVVSIFLSPLDVHINRAPIAGRITDITFTKGKFLMATKELASLVNEQNALTIEGADATLVCKQIAGVLARRIVCWKKNNDSVKLGERFGLIKFSSRTDLILPPHISVEVCVGDRVRGGETIIGRIGQRSGS
jgi:phosphatidylserine decarboxylase